MSHKEAEIDKKKIIQQEIVPSFLTVQRFTINENCDWAFQDTTMIRSLDHCFHSYWLFYKFVFF